MVIRSLFPLLAWLLDLRLRMLGRARSAGLRAARPRPCPVWWRPDVGVGRGTPHGPRIPLWRGADRLDAVPYFAPVGRTQATLTLAKTNGVASSWTRDSSPTVEADGTMVSPTEHLFLFPAPRDT